MVLSFLFQSAAFQFLTCLYWGLAVCRWVEIAVAGNMTWPAFRQSAALITGLYVALVGLAAITLEAFV